MTVLFAVQYEASHDGAADAFAVGILESAAVHGQHVLLGIAEDLIAHVAEVLGLLHGDLGRFLADGQRSDVVVAGDLDHQKVVGHIQDTDGLTELGLQIFFFAVNVVDDDIGVAVFLEGFMVFQIILKGILIQLPVEIIEPFVLFGLLHDFGIAVGAGSLPDRLDLLLSLVGGCHIPHDILDDIVGDELGGQPLVIEGGHSRFNIDGTPLGVERDVRVHEQSVVHF